MNYPTSLDNGTSLPNPTGGSTQNNPDHAGLHTSENQAIIALESKVGTGATTPAANTILFGTGSGTSAWTGITSAQLAATLSDETGTGSAVFANTPTLVTPKVDTINENTLNNGVTVGGVNLKGGVITGTGTGITGIPNASLATGIQSSKLTNPYKFSVYHNTTQSVSSSSIITFNTKLFDTGNNYDGINKFTAPVTGYYLISGQIYYTNLNAQGRIILLKNGTSALVTASAASMAGSDYGAGTSVPVFLTAGDYVQVQAYLSTGTNTLFGAAGAPFTYFSGFLISST